MAKIVIYSTSHCPYCVRAKNLFTKKGLSFEEVQMDERPDELRELKKRTGLMTVPQIFINDKLIGGFSDVAALDEKGELDTLLK